jgi:hypothetical protein
MKELILYNLRISSESGNTVATDTLQGTVTNPIQTTSLSVVAPEGGENVVRLENATIQLKNSTMDFGQATVQNFPSDVPFNGNVTQSPDQLAKLSDTTWVEDAIVDFNLTTFKNALITGTNGNLVENSALPVVLSRSIDNNSVITKSFELDGMMTRMEKSVQTATDTSPLLVSFGVFSSNFAYHIHVHGVSQTATTYNEWVVLRHKTGGATSIIVKYKMESTPTKLRAPVLIAAGANTIEISQVAATTNDGPVSYSFYLQQYPV